MKTILAIIVVTTIYHASKIDLYATKWFNKNNKIGLIYH